MSEDNKAKEPNKATKATTKDAEAPKVEQIEAEVTKEFTKTSYAKVKGEDGGETTKPELKTYKVGDIYKGPKGSVDFLVSQGKVKLKTN